MNPDREFADFLLTMTPEEFDDWANKKSIEEVAQATEIVRRAVLSLADELDMYIESDLEYTDYQEAKEVLSRFTLTGN